MVSSETDEVLVVTRAGCRQATWCPRCNARVPLLSPDDAALVAGVSARTVYRWVEAGRVHFLESPGGSLRICVASLRS